MPKENNPNLCARTEGLMCTHTMQHTELPGWWCRCEAVASPGMADNADVSCHQCHVCVCYRFFFLMYCYSTYLSELSTL